VVDLRDYFAAKAMQAYLANPEALRQLTEAIRARQVEAGHDEREALHWVLARRAYLLADVLPDHRRSVHRHRSALRARRCQRISRRADRGAPRNGALAPYDRLNRGRSD
jgi:hypothetical protein